MCLLSFCSLLISCLTDPVLVEMQMGEGDIASAAPIIGSLTRTVEYLQLTIEADEKPKPTLLQPITLLEESCSWAEAEERRRVFWNVFILDRYVLQSYEAKPKSYFTLLFLKQPTPKVMLNNGGVCIPAWHRRRRIN